MLKLQTGNETIYFNKDENKRVVVDNTIYELQNNNFYVKDKQTGQILMQKSYQDNYLGNQYYQEHNADPRAQQGSVLWQPKGYFPVVTARMPTGNGFDFFKPDRYQTTYRQGDDYIRTQYTKPLQMVEYDPINQSIQQIDPINDRIEKHYTK